MRELSLFTGAGGGLQGTRLLGWSHIGYVEHNKHCQQVIRARIEDGLLDHAPFLPIYVSSLSPVRLKSTGDLRTWLQRVSRASHFPSTDEKKGMLTTGICGVKLSKLLDKFSQHIVFSKTCQGFCQLEAKAWRTRQDDLFADTSAQFYGSFPKAGLMQGGVCSELTMWVQPIVEKDCGFMQKKLFPTPRRSEYKGCGAMGSKSHKHMLARDYLCAVVQDDETQSKQLTPDWVEALMGWQIGWSSVNSSGHVDWRFNWKNWEQDLSRVAIKTKEHKHRLMAIGNGQVPLCAAVAWSVLHKGFE